MNGNIGGGSGGGGGGFRAEAPPNLDPCALRCAITVKCAHALDCELWIESRVHLMKMRKTLFDFCARSTGERDEIPSSAESSLDLESSDVAQDTDSVISKYYLTYWPK